MDSGDKSSSFAIPHGYEYLEPHVSALFKDAPNYAENVFIIMRLIKTIPMQQIYKVIVGSLSRMGLRSLRADQKTYHPELWGNVCTYMLGCSKAVIVFEDIEQREFNPNVALEFGFMIALNKPCLILKEKRLPKPPTDTIGHLWRDFDSFAMEDTIPDQISRWLVDINWSPPPSHLPKPVARAMLHEASSFHHVLEALDLEFSLEILFDEAAASVFEGIATKVAYSGPIFQGRTILEELAQGDDEMRDLLLERDRIAEIYKTKVLMPLKNAKLNSKQRIMKAHEGVKAVLEKDLNLVRKIEGTCI